MNSAPDAPRVDDDLHVQQIAVYAFELTVIHKGKELESYLGAMHNFQAKALRLYALRDDEALTSQPDLDMAWAELQRKENASE